MNLPESIKQFPVTPYLEDICEKLKKSSCRSLVLTAETGAGKSTVLPVGLLAGFEGKILMTEPRRLAVLAVADRVSSLLQQECGKTAGYRIHLENKISSETRLEVMTEAVLVRMLQKDPALEGINLVVLDEFHERGINLDLALAFLKEAQELRDDLFVIVMSATMDTEKTAAFLGGAEVISIPGRTFPVEIKYDGKSEICDAIEQQVLDLKIKPGDKCETILVFLPGIAEIRRCAQELNRRFEGNSTVQVKVLHSSVSLEEQREVLVPGPAGVCRVVVSSAIAETSITIPDVTVVIDSGLSRINKINLSTGMNQLVTQVESQFSATQRSGRAGRVQAGKCLRLWNQNEARIQELPAEILRTDLTELVLECSERGIYSPEKIQWLDSPSAAGWKTSSQLLKKIGFMNQEGRITERGKAGLSLGTDVRLASMALEGKSFENLGIKTDYLSLVLKYSQYSQSAAFVQNKFIEDLKKRLEKTGRIESLLSAVCDFSKERKPDTENILLAAFPDRLAKKVSQPGVEPEEYQFWSGRKAFMSRDLPKTSASSEWICAPEVNATDRGTLIFSYEEMKGPVFEAWLSAKTEEKIVCSFENGKVTRNRIRCYGEIELFRKKEQPAPEDFSAAWINEIQKKGLECLPMDQKLESFLLRSEFFHINGKGFENLQTQQDFRQQLQEKAEQWLTPFMTGNGNLTAKTVYDGLYWFLNGQEIDSSVPEQLVLETGRKVKVKYEKTGGKRGIQPVIEVIIQRIFGCFSTPEICGVPVLLKLLSPASRPLQITEDLAGFWSGSWIEICKEMKGRYPKHNWDYRVAEKED